MRNNVNVKDRIKDKRKIIEYKIIPNNKKDLKKLSLK